MSPESILFKKSEISSNLEKEFLSGYYSLQVIQGNIIFPFELKKCCKKYKKGKRCKKCPLH